MSLLPAPFDVLLRGLGALGAPVFFVGLIATGAALYGWVRAAITAIRAGISVGTVMSAWTRDRTSELARIVVGMGALSLTGMFLLYGFCQCASDFVQTGWAKMEGQNATLFNADGWPRILDPAHASQFTQTMMWIGAVSLFLIIVSRFSAVQWTVSLVYIVWVPIGIVLALLGIIPAFMFVIGSIVTLFTTPNWGVPVGSFTLVLVTWGEVAVLLGLEKSMNWYLDGRE